MQEKTLLKCFILLVGLMLQSQTKLAEPIPQNSKVIFKTFEKELLKLPEHSQISIGIIDNDNVNYLGVIKKNDNLSIIDNRYKIFEIGSISKVFTSILFSHFVQEKKLNLNDTLEHHLNFKLASGNEITLKQLSNHTSGLHRLPQNIFLLLSLHQDNPYKYYNPNLLNKYLKEDVFLLHPVGKKYFYSNLGTGILGYILTLKSESSYEELIQQYIFQPLKMFNSSTKTASLDSLKLVKGRKKDGTVCPNWEFTDALVGAGGIKSNTKDLVKFINQNFEDNKVYHLTHKTTFKINETREIGLGWFISKTNNTNIHWHNGATGGYRSCIALEKSEKKGIIVLSNISPELPEASLIDKICLQSLKKLLAVD